MAKPELKIKAATAQEICKQFPLSERGRPLLKADMSPLAFVDSLVADFTKTGLWHRG